MIPNRTGYEGVALVAPFTVPYERYSIRSAQWFAAQALRGLLKEAKLDKSQIDGISLSSFLLRLIAARPAIVAGSRDGMAPRTALRVYPNDILPRTQLLFRRQLLQVTTLRC